MEVLYENDTPMVNENEDIHIKINGYQYVQIEDFSSDLRIPFGDQTKTGGLIIFDATINNESSKSVYMSSGFTMSVTGFSASISNKKDLVENELMPNLVKQKFEVKAGETMSGYVALTVKPEAMEKIEEHGSGMFEFPGSYSVEGSFKKDDAIVEPKKELISLTDEGDKTTKSASSFYEDKATVENWGTKKLLVENEPKQEVEFQNVKVKFDGYQITEFVPNEDRASRFKNFETGSILMTIKLTVKNDSQETLKFGNTSATLTIGNSVKLMYENMLEISASIQEDLEQGKEDTRYLVFIMDKESYEKMYKYKDYLLDISIKNSKNSTMTKNNDIAFEFSN